MEHDFYQHRLFAHQVPTTPYKSSFGSKMSAMHVKCPVWNKLQCNNRIRYMSIMMSLCLVKKATLLFHAVESIKPRMKLEHRYSPWHDTDNAISSFRIKMLGCQHITSSFFPFIKTISWLINGCFQFHSESGSMNMNLST